MFDFTFTDGGMVRVFFKNEKEIICSIEVLFIWNAVRVNLYMNKQFVGFKTFNVMKYESSPSKCWEKAVSDIIF